MNLKNYYWYFDSELSDKICDDIIEYELSPNDYSVILDDTNDVNSNWSKLIKDYNKENEDEW